MIVRLISQQTVSKFNVKIKDGDKEVDEEVEIDTEKQTETLSIPKTDSGNAGEVKVIFDFKKVTSDVKKSENRSYSDRKGVILEHAYHFIRIDQVLLNDDVGNSRKEIRLNCIFSELFIVTLVISQFTHPTNDIFSYTTLARELKPFHSNIFVYLFLLQNLTMQRLSAAKACFLSDSTENAPKPDDLLQALELGQVIQLRFSELSLMLQFTTGYCIEQP